MEFLVHVILCAKVVSATRLIICVIKNIWNHSIVIDQYYPVIIWNMVHTYIPYLRGVDVKTLHATVMMIAMKAAIVTIPH